MRLDAAITEATRRLSASSDSARLDAELLLCQTIDMPRSYLFAHPEDELDEVSLARFEAYLQRRLGGEPIPYITGVQEFWSHKLQVTPATLVPRPETELLVDLALRQIPVDAECAIADLGTGSGAIAIAIAADRRLCQVTATDISPAALAVAAENARAAGLLNLSFVCGHWAQPLAGMMFDVIVSNPPYIEAGDAALQDLQHEPATALAAGHDGLDDIRELAACAGAVSKHGGYLMLEHGYNQQTPVHDLLAGNGWTDITCHNDLAGLPRVTVARRNVK